MKEKQKRPPLLYRIVPERGFMPVLALILLHMASYYVPRLINGGRAHLEIKTAADTLIPFVPVFVVFYVLAFLQWGVYYLILAREEESVMKRYFVAGAVSKLLCMALFIILPTTITRPEPGTGVFGFCCRVIYAMDEPNNLFPSMHCLESWLCMRLALEEKRKGRVPELARSMVKGYRGEMILCVNRRRVKSLKGYITRVKRREIEVVFEKLLSRRRWRLEEVLDDAADDVAEAAEDMGMVFVKAHTVRTCVLSVLVLLSTLFIKQHYLADAVSAIIIAELSLFMGKIASKPQKRESGRESGTVNPKKRIGDGSFFSKIKAGASFTKLTVRIGDGSYFSKNKSGRFLYRTDRADMD